MREIIYYKLTTKERKSYMVFGTKYELDYSRGVTVRAHPNTLGIMCYKTKKSAQRDRITEDALILRVCPIGRKKEYKRVGLLTYLDEFYKFPRRIRYAVSPPEGTVCFPAVRVLD